MRHSSLDRQWELLIENHVRGRRMPWLDWQWYHTALAWLRWKLRRACRRRL
jgi:hypothetical protein